MTMGKDEQGCDIEYVCKRDRKEWELLFEGRFLAPIGQYKRKLAYGSNTIVFCKRPNENSIPVINELPVELVNEIVKVLF